MCLALITTALSVSSADATVGSCPQWEPLFRKHGLPAKVFSKIAYRESRCNPKSVSAVRKSTGRPDVGLLQIQGSWVTVTAAVCKVPRKQVVKALTNASCNVQVARYLYDNGGLGHWRVTSGK
jgi:membrane-bound lytic murein transglycosylase MltF